MHEPRLTRELRALLREQRVAALGSVNDDGTAMVSMVPFAIEPGLACLVIHVSELAAHTRNLRARPEVSLLVMRPERTGEPVLALPRATLQGVVETLDADRDAWARCRAAYLARFPDAEPIAELGDFRFLAVRLRSARQVAGFGVARSVGGEELAQVLGAVDGAGHDTGRA